MTMQGELRRADRLLALEDTEALLGRALVGRVGSVSEGGMPYVTPMNYVWDGERRAVYIHMAGEAGHLAANLRARPGVCFEVDEPGEVIATGAYVCNTSQVYSSAIGFGAARYVDDPREKVHALRLFERKYVKALMPERSYNKAMPLFDKLLVFALEITTLTGKRREMP
jgi:nitroimidazol reductase NimA-like FMN-containing flavoprotein (pyridoxamine 5'-phosphate oxidase superfamily)